MGCCWWKLSCEAGSFAETVLEEGLFIVEPNCQVELLDLILLIVCTSFSSIIIIINIIVGVVIIIIILAGQALGESLSDSHTYSRGLYIAAAKAEAVIAVAVEYVLGVGGVVGGVFISSDGGLYYSIFVIKVRAAQAVAPTSTGCPWVCWSMFATSMQAPLYSFTG